MRTHCLLPLALSLLLPACHMETAAKSPAILPLRTLRLYETGVGYFERSGDMTGATSLPVPAGHLDDALKSLVILSEGRRSTVSGLEFDSSMSRSMARALSGLPQGGDDPLSYRDLLLSLKGASLELSTATERLTGRLIEVTNDPGPRLAESADRKDSGEKKEGGEKKLDEDRTREGGRSELLLLILTERGEVRRVRTVDLVSVRPTDPGFAARLGSTLDSLSTRTAQVSRPLRLFGELRGPVTFGYIAETPIWRATYRVVLDPAGQGGTLQGWALLHNDTDEGWQGIKLSLVNGRPDSFLFPLAAPRYLKRELVHPDEALSTVPQLAGQTADMLWGDTGDGGEGIGLGSVGTIGHGSGGGGSGVGFGQGRVSGASDSTLLSVGNLASVAQAKGTESGALFSYALDRPISLGAHSSALVPFLEQRVDAGLITFIGEGGDGPPRMAVRFVNATGQTLPAGTVAFFSEGGFAGESTLDRLKPKERRFVQFGADIDVELTRKPSRSAREVKRISYAHDSIEEHFLKTTWYDFEIENRGGQKRAVYVSLPLHRNASLTGVDEVDFDQAESRPMAVFRVEPRSKLARAFTSVEGLSVPHSIESLTSESLGELAAQPALPAAERAAVKEALARRLELEANRKEVAGLKSEQQVIEKELERLREDLRALQGEKGATEKNPFVTRILAAEDRLAQTRRRLGAAEAQDKTKADAVRAAFERLTGK